MNVAPVFSDCATLNALRTTSGITSAASMQEAYLVIGRNRSSQVQNLVRFLVQTISTGLAGDRHQRRMVHIGVGDTGHQVGGAGPQGRQADAGALPVSRP